MTNDGRGNRQLMETNCVVGPTWCILCGSASDPKHFAEKHPGVFCAVYGHQRADTLTSTGFQTLGHWKPCHRCGTIIDTEVARFSTSLDDIIASWLNAEHTKR